MNTVSENPVANSTPTPTPRNKALTGGSVSLGQKAVDELVEALFGMGFTPNKASSRKSMDEINKPVVADKSSVDVEILFLKEVYKYANTETKQKLEKRFPRVFPRPTYKVGDRLRQYFTEKDVDGYRELLIVGPSKNEVVNGFLHNRIALVDLKTGEVRQETTSVKNLSSITESELLEAGKSFGLTRTNYVI